MDTTVSGPSAHAHLPRTDIRAQMAKADLRKAENWREQIGRAIERARLLRGWSLKELADAVGRDERQLARWITGAERAQLDAIFAVESFRTAFVIALAEIAGDQIEVTTQIIVKKARTA
jgi:ribosome-binding protein aMBF1 (putative translation factor)